VSVHEPGVYQEDSSARRRRRHRRAGRRGGIRPGDLVGAIAGETGVPASAIGAIEIADSYSLVSVPEEFAEQVIAGMKKATLRGQKVTIRRERERPR
jgi:ATP-dependent RNA helicase DeaD